MDISPLFWLLGVWFNDDRQVLHCSGIFFPTISRLQELYPKVLMSPFWRPRGSSSASEKEIISQ